MAQFGRFTIPPWRATVNVAWETFKAMMPESSPCFEGVSKPPGERVHFAQQQGGQAPGGYTGESCEMSTLPGEGG